MVPVERPQQATPISTTLNVTYYETTPEQLAALVAQSSHCYQPVKLDCRLTQVSSATATSPSSSTAASPRSVEPLLPARQARLPPHPGQFSHCYQPVKFDCRLTEVSSATATSPSTSTAASPRSVQPLLAACQVRLPPH